MKQEEYFGVFFLLHRSNTFLKTQHPKPPVRFVTMAEINQKRKPNNKKRNQYLKPLGCISSF